MFWFMRKIGVKVLIAVVAFAVVKGITGGDYSVSTVWDTLTEGSDTVKSVTPEIGKTLLEPLGQDSQTGKDPQTSEPSANDEAQVKN